MHNFRLKCLIGCLVCACFAYSLIRRKAKISRSRPLSKIVVVYTTGNIGDMIFVTPMFRALKHAQAQARLNVVGVPKNGIVLAGNADVDAYIPYTQNVLNTICKIRKEKYEFGCTPQRGVIDLALLYLGGVKEITAFSGGGLWYRLLTRLVTTVDLQPRHNMAIEYQRLLHPLNIDSVGTGKYLAYSADAMDEVQSKLTAAGIDPHSDRLLAIAPGAGTKIKQWPAARFAEVANIAAHKLDAKIVIIGGPNDGNERDQMIANLDSEIKYFDAVGQSIDELKATLALCDLIVANDSGPVYIAEAFGASTVVLVGPTDELQHPPQGESHRVILARNRTDPIMASFQNREEVDANTARSQMESITVEEVVAAVAELWRPQLPKATAAQSATIATK